MDCGPGTAYRLTVVPLTPFEGQPQIRTRHKDNFPCAYKAHHTPPYTIVHYYIHYHTLLHSHLEPLKGRTTLKLGVTTLEHGGATNEHGGTPLSTPV